MDRSIFNFSLLLFTLIWQSCASVGPKSIPGDQFNFNNSINEASSKQLLLNLVRLRYSEQPTFLKVSSVVNQYTRAGSASAGGNVSNGINGDGASIGVGAAWSNTPTITYLPIRGKEFSQNLLTPLPPGALLSLIQSGWPIELVMKTAVWSINGLFDEVARPSGRRSADSQLAEFSDLWQQLTNQGVIGFKKTIGNPDGVELFFRQTNVDQYKGDIQKFKSMINLDDEVNSYLIEYGLIQKNAKEIVVITGSVWEIMLNLAWYFKAPAQHVTSGRTGKGLVAEDSTIVAPINIQYSEQKPEDSFIEVFAQDHWFYIAENDRNSKRYFSFLQLIVSLSENQTPAQAPALTLPTN